MKKIVFALTMLVVCAAAMAQTPKTVLDRTATVISNPGGITATFKMTGGMGNASGTIAVKGKKFQACSPVATIWFNGKTMWTYMKKNDEVNVTNPTESQLAAINPYNFIHIYKQGYSYTLEKDGRNYIVRLYAKDKKKSIQEMSIWVTQKSYIPYSISYRTAKGVTTINITNFKAMNIPDGTFRFNSKDFPRTEVIDLR
jgi:outer membrane lipoprotein-sorting protein